MIQERFEVSLTLPSVGRLLASLDITPQKPLRRAYERDKKEIRKWKEERYPELRKRAMQRGAEIFFLDEVGVRSDRPLGMFDGNNQHCILRDARKLKVTIAQMRTRSELSGAPGANPLQSVSKTCDELSVPNG